MPGRSWWWAAGSPASPRRWSWPKRALPVTVVEAADRFGGKIATNRVDGLVVEAGADSFLSTKPAGLALVERLGIGDRLVNSKADDRRTFVWSRGRLRELPEGLVLGSPARAWSLLRSGLLSPPGAARLVGDVAVRRRRTDDGLRRPPKRPWRSSSPAASAPRPTPGSSSRCWPASTPATPPASACRPPSRASSTWNATTAASSVPRWPAHLPRLPVPVAAQGIRPGLRHRSNWRSLTGIRRKRNADSGQRNGRDGSGGSDAVRFVPDRHG